jgi:hypothetical protein
MNPDLGRHDTMDSRSPARSLEDAMPAWRDELAPELRPLADQYAPALAQMAVEEAWAWIDLLAAGSEEEAWRTLLDRMPSEELAGQWQELSDGWSAARRHVAERRALQQQAVRAVLHGVLSILLARVGLAGPPSEG